MYFWIEWKITFACKRSSFLLCWQSCLCLPVNCPGLHLLHCFPSSLLPKAGCLGPDEEKRKHNCARELPLHVHSALMHAVIRSCMDSLLHASIALGFSFGKFAPHIQGHSHSLGNVTGGHWFCSSSAARTLLLCAFENWVTFWNSSRGSARSCCLFRGIAEVAGTSVSSGFYCSPSLCGNRCIQMLTLFLSCFAPLPQDPHKTEHRRFQVMQRCCSLQTYFMWCCSGAGTALHSCGAQAYCEIAVSSFCLRL